MTNVMPILLQQPFGMIIVLAVIGATAGIIAAIASEVGKYARHRTDAELKRELVERGLSVDEIERIVTAKSAEHVDKSNTLSGSQIENAANSRNVQHA